MFSLIGFAIELQNRFISDRILQGDLCNLRDKRILKKKNIKLCWEAITENNFFLFSSFSWYSWYSSVWSSCFSSSAVRQQRRNSEEYLKTPTQFTERIVYNNFIGINHFLLFNIPTSEGRFLDGTEKIVDVFLINLLLLGRCWLLCCNLLHDLLLLRCTWSLCWQWFSSFHGLAIECTILWGDASHPLEHRLNHAILWSLSETQLEALEVGQVGACTLCLCAFSPQWLGPLLLDLEVLEGLLDDTGRCGEWELDLELGQMQVAHRVLLAWNARQWTVDEDLKCMEMVSWCSCKGFIRWLSDNFFSFV